jgi:CRP-like cAMP-binding protein
MFGMTTNRNSKPAGGRQTVRTYPLAARIYSIGAPGAARRVLRGTVRLDRIGADGTPMFASLAMRGDVIGAETLLFGIYTFEAVALSECELASWPEASERASRESLLQVLAVAEQRAADVMALRCGQAAERVMRLIRLLSSPQQDDAGAPRVILPSRRDIADITALTPETVCRTIARLQRTGTLIPKPLPGARKDRGFCLTTEPLAPHWG